MLVLCALGGIHCAACSQGTPHEDDVDPHGNTAHSMPSRRTGASQRRRWKRVPGIIDNMERVYKDTVLPVKRSREHSSIAVLKTTSAGSSSSSGISYTLDNNERHVSKDRRICPSAFRVPNSQVAHHRKGKLLVRRESSTSHRCGSSAEKSV